MLILMRETDLGKLWPVRAFENVDDFGDYISTPAVVQDFIDEAIYQVFVVGCSYRYEMYQPNVQRWDYSFSSDCFLQVETPTKMWHDDGDWW